jgi:hypothetical protein
LKRKYEQQAHHHNNTAEVPNFGPLSEGLAIIEMRCAEK